MKNSWVSRSLLLHFVASLIIEFGQIMETFKLNVNLNFCIWHRDWYLRDRSEYQWDVCIPLLIADWENGIGRRRVMIIAIRNVFCLVDCSVTTHHMIITDLSRCSAWQIRVTCHESVTNVTNVRSRARQLNYHNIHQWGSDCKITFVVVRLRLRFQCTLTLSGQFMIWVQIKAILVTTMLLAGPLAASD